MSVMSVTNAQPVQRIGFFRALWRAIRQVFHETTGAVFCLLALMWANSALRVWRTGSGRWIWGSCLGFAMVMAFFAWVSFRAARRVR